MHPVGAPPRTQPKAAFVRSDKGMGERQISSTSDTSVDSSPLLRGSTNELSNGVDGGRLVPRRGSLSRLFRFLRRRSSGRVMREPSAIVRESAVEQLEERQSDWAYSRPVVILDLTWNLTFIMATVAVLILSSRERPDNPLRVWVLGYALQCFIHMTCVYVEHKRRRRNRAHGILQSSNAPSFSNSGSGIPSQRSQDMDVEHMFNEPTFHRTSIAKRIESANTSVSFVWWVIGFYWITAGNQYLRAPLLFWLCVAFLAFDVFFVFFCVFLACIIGIAACCCLPCIIAVMYAVAEQEGASEEEIRTLPKFIFHRTGSFVKSGEDLAGPSSGIMTMVVTNGAPIERNLAAEDAECCICLSSYDEGVELRELPCGHHFHCACIDRWLRMNSTCPLCKDDISQDDITGREDV